MKISFDIDDTLILYDSKKKENNNCRLLNGEILRYGTINLLKELEKEHELWIYTTSFRSPWVLKLCFWLKGVKIKKVVNQNLHSKIIKSKNISATKLPSYFGIDLHVDDSLGVVEEGKKFGFDVIVIDPNDEEWTVKVKEEIQKKIFYS